MKRYPNIDYSYQPKSYWDEDNVLQTILRDVKGAERRKMIKAYYEDSNLQELDGVFMQSSLTNDERKYLGAIHPMFMGGEYLPDYNPGETEIARIELKSVTRDVISLRVKKKNGLLRYSLVDEYDEHTFWPAKKTSKKPFTLAGLIDFIGNSNHDIDQPGGLVFVYNNYNESGGCSRESLESFTTISSEIYTQLKQHYQNVFAGWVAGEQIEEEVNW